MRLDTDRGRFAMRILCLLLFVFVFLSGGCAQMMASCGKDMGRLHTREEVHAQFGEPVAMGFAEGRFFEEFHTRKRIAQNFGEGYVMVWILTCGAADLVFVPCELYLTGRRTLLGQTIRVSYDEADRTKGVDLDGRAMLLGRGRVASRLNLGRGP
jgi:YD repeat-containing protein